MSFRTVILSISNATEVRTISSITCSVIVFKGVKQRGRKRDKDETK